MKKILTAIFFCILAMSSISTVKAEGPSIVYDSQIDVSCFVSAGTNLHNGTIILFVSTSTNAFFYQKPYHTLNGEVLKIFHGSLPDGKTYEFTNVTFHVSLKGTRTLSDYETVTLVNKVQQLITEEVVWHTPSEFQDPQVQQTVLSHMARIIDPELMNFDLTAQTYGLGIHPMN